MPARTPTLILDNGGSDIKSLLVPPSSPTEPSTPQPAPPPTHPKKARLLPPPRRTRTPTSTPNALARAPASAARSTMLGAEITAAPDPSGLSFRRPQDRGVVCDWALQRDLWACVLSAEGVCASVETGLVVTEALGVPLRARRAMDEMVFEEFDFVRYAPVCPAVLAASACGRRTALVLDSGFSFTHAVPLVDGVVVGYAARRLAVGGKLLTNYLKELISFRSWNMSDETAVVNAVKERLCYVSLHYGTELASCRRRRGDVAREYVLPDVTRAGDRYGHIASGEERDGSEQVLVMNNERIAVPEILFNPSDIGLQQAGVAELICQAVDACPLEVRAELYANVVLVGGNCLFPNFRERLVAELRPLVCADYEVAVYMDSEPIFTTVRGGACAVTDERQELPYVTRQEFEEGGSDAVLRRLYGDAIR